MAVVLRPVASLPAGQLDGLFSTGGWPAFIEADERAGAALPRVRERFGGHELAAVEDDTVLAAGWGVPLVWTGQPEDLPGGYTDSLHRALAANDRGRPPDTFVLGAIQVRPDTTGRGLASWLVAALVEHAEKRGLTRIIAPLRPTLKSRYPLTPIAAYAAWTREDGTAFDPWLRLHLRLGARVIGVAEASQSFTGSVAQWETWTGLALPDSGHYIVPEALAPLTVDRTADRAVCVEPGIWVQHRPGPQG